MMRREMIKKIVNLVVTILTAALTALGATSCR